MIKRKQLILTTFLLLSSVLALNGCKKKKKPPETEAQPVIMTERVTEKETQPPTEKQTEKRLTLRDIQVQVPKASRSGNFSYQITEGKSITASGTGSFESTSSAFHASNGTSDYYSTSSDAAYNTDGTYRRMEGIDFVDIWSNIYSEDAIQKSDVLADNIPCYYISCDEEDNMIGSIIGLCYISGYTEVMCGTTQIDAYISKDSLDVIRLDAHTPFKATFGESDVNGELTVSFKCKLDGNVSITLPDIYEEEEEPVDTYEPGVISEGQNSYKNKMFDIQLVGRESFYFDTYKTEELSASYQEIKSPYREEAYASGDGIIVNISSIAKGDSTKENILARYLTDSNATEIQAGGVFNSATNSYICSLSTINDTKTKTYCTESADRVLIITLYYSDDAFVSTFESNFYGTDDDPFWEASTWVLKGKYTVTTPKGYTVSKQDSSDMFVCLTSSQHDVNIFAKTGTSVDSEYEIETTTVGDKVREVTQSEDIALNDGSTMRYCVVHNTEPSYVYYTYIGLNEVDGTVFEYYMVSTAGDADYKDIFAEIANTMTVETQENNDALEEQPEQP